MERNLRLISPLERAFHMKKIGGLRDIAPADLASISLAAREYTFAPGATVSRRGERVDRVHVVVDGEVRVAGAEHDEAVVGAGHAIGMLTLLARDDEGLDAVATRDTVTLALCANDLFEAFEADFGLLYNQLRYLATEILRLRKRIPAGTYLPTEGPPEGLRTDDVGLVERVLHMSRGGFKGVNMDALMAMAERMVTTRVEAGTRLWEIGEPSGFMYVILGGRVACATSDGTPFTCGPGYPLGNLESQCGAPRWYTAITETPLVALRTDTDVFLDTIEQHFDMAVAFVASMARGLINRRAEMRHETPVESTA